MSAATEYPPVVHIPAQARQSRPRLVVVAGTAGGVSDPLPSPSVRPLRVATIRPAVVQARLTAPAGAASLPTPLRLTRRGMLVLGLLSVLITGALLGAASLSASAAVRVPPASSASTVVVRQGDTLWSVATQVAPSRDPRAVVDELQRLNHLDSAALTPGQVLHTR
jgi:LysM repeat protein